MDLAKLTIDRTNGPSQVKKGRRSRRLWYLIAGACVAIALWFFRAPLLDAFNRARGTEVELVRAVMVDPGARSAQAAAISGAAANGYLVARRRAALSADTPGRIVELNVEEGSVMSKGDVVARLFSDEAEASLRRAEADLATGLVAVRAAAARIVAARSRLDEARALVGNVTSQRDEIAASLKLARSELERAKGLVERGAVPKELLDRAESTHTQAKARLAGAESGLIRTDAAVLSADSDVALAELEKEQAEANIASLEALRDLAAATLDKTVVRAPFDGVVVLKDAEVGEVVSPNALGGQSRGSVATMVDFRTLEVQVELPETSLGSVTVGRPAEVYLDAFARERFKGTVLRIWPTANRQKATIEVRVGLDTIDKRMRPEMGARVVFPPAAPDTESAAGATAGESAESQEPQLLIPASALVTKDGGRGVFVVQSGVATFRPIEAGEALGLRVAVSSGLTEGDVVVASPPADLASGARVNDSE